MIDFWKIITGVLITVVLCIVLNKQNKDLSLVLILAVSVMVLFAAMRYIEPVFAFVDKLQAIGNLDTSVLQIILKAVGISLVAEIAALVCQDSGNAALGKAVQIFATVAVLWVSLPLMESLMDLLQKIMGEA